MDSTFDEGLRIVLQWMERRRRDIQLVLQKELYTLRRMFYPRFYYSRRAGGLLPGGDATEYKETPIQEELDDLRYMLQFTGRKALKYAPGIVGCLPLYMSGTIQ